MAFFGYDPYDYYAAAAPYNYPYDAYYQRQPAPTTRRSRSRADIFAGAGAEPAARDTKTSFSIPIHGPDSDPEPEPKRKPKRKAAPVGARTVPLMSAEEAGVRLQAAARGFLARKSVRAVRDVAREAEQVLAKIASSEAEALVADTRARLALGEELMRMVLRLDAVHGARAYRRRVTKRVLALQDAVDELVTNPAPAEEEEDAEVSAPEATAVEMAEASAAAPEPADAAAKRGSEMESIQAAVHAHTQMEVDEAVATGEPEAEEPEKAAGEEHEVREEDEAVAGDADADVEGEWEMFTGENEDTAPVTATADDDSMELPHKEPAACPLEITARIASLGADGVDVTKVMEMVAALCEQSAQQCAVIGALADRVDALERTVRRMADAESRHRRTDDTAINRD